jgi:hypothetical protein
MISFRYHLITIVSIFLAVALGIVMGASFIRGPLVEQLTQQTNDAIEKSDRLEADLRELQDRFERLDEFAAEAFPLLAAARLAQVPVVVVTQQGTSAEDLDAARSAVTRAGGIVEAELVLTRRLLAADEDDATALAEILDMSPSSLPTALTEAASDRLGSRLSAGPAPQADAEADVLGGLLAAGFVTTPRPPEDLSRVGGLGTVVLAVAGGSGGPEMEVEDVLVPVVRAYARSGRAVAAEGSESDYPFVRLIRSDEELRERVTTVDDVDLGAGQIALVLGMADLVENGTVGHYGLDGDSRLPPAGR